MSDQGRIIPGDGRKHVHSSYIWLGGLRAIGVLIVAIIIGCASSISSLIELLSYSSVTSNLGTSILFAVIGGVAILVVIMALVFGVHAWAWRHLWYELGPEEVSVYSGILSKKRVHVPYDRIQTVDQKASLLQRVFGVCNITIDTAGGASNKAVLIPYLRKCDADELRHELYARKMVLAEGATSAATIAASAGVSTSAPACTEIPAPTGDPVIAAPPSAATTPSGNILDVGDEAWQQFGGVFAGDAFAMDAPSYEYRLSNKELVFTGLSNNGGFVLALLAILAAVGSFISFAYDVFPQETAVIIEGTASRFDPAILAVIGGIILIIGAAIGWCISVVGTCLQFGGFHARRRGTRIEVERGLLKHQTESLDISRVQSVIIKQTFIRRIIGYCELSLGKINAADSESSSESSSAAQQGLIVHPFIKVDRVQAVLDGLVPEFADIPDATTRVAPVALRRGLIRRCLWQGNGFWLAVCTVLFQMIMHGVALLDPDIIDAIPIIDLVCIVLYLFAVVLLAFDIVGAVLWFRESAFATNRRFARIKNGGLSSIDISLPRQKIQFGSTKANPLQRLANTATIQARTAAGIGGTTTQLIDVSQEEATAWLTWITPHLTA